MSEMLPIHERLLRGLREVFQPLGLTEAQMAAIDLFENCNQGKICYVAGFRCEYWDQVGHKPRRWECCPWDSNGFGGYRINTFITIYFGPGD